MKVKRTEREAEGKEKKKIQFKKKEGGKQYWLNKGIHK